MRTWMYAAVLLAGPALAQPALPTKDEPAKKEASKSKPAAQGNTIAKVNGVAVPRSREDLLMQQQGARGMPDNDQTRAMVLDMTRQEVMVSAYIRDWAKANPVSDADVQKEYERAKAQTGDKEYKARHILVETEEQAKSLIAELKKGGKFEDLATKNSKDPGSAQRGGDLDWNVPGTYDKQFAEALVKLEKGKYTDKPVQTRFGYHIIMLEDVRPVKFPALNDVRQRITQQITQGRIEELVKSLRAKAKVE